MNSKLIKRRLLVATVLGGAVGMLASCQQTGNSLYGMVGAGQQVTLSGSSEFPPVTTTASGSGLVDIKPDGRVSAKITVEGMTPTAAHIHEAAAGSNGPVILPLRSSGGNTFVAPEGARLIESQLAGYKAGRLYIDVHSAKNPMGEIRAQLKGM